MHCYEPAYALLYPKRFWKAVDLLNPVPHLKMYLNIEIHVNKRAFYRVAKPGHCRSRTQNRPLCGSTSASQKALLSLTSLSFFPFLLPTSYVMPPC